MEINEKTKREGGKYIVVEDDEGTRYFFTQKGDAWSPSTIGATDEEGLTRACDHLTANGYELVMGRMRPAGFEYES